MSPIHYSNLLKKINGALQLKCPIHRCHTLYILKNMWADIISHYFETNDIAYFE